LNTLINIISSTKGGGAELLVRELHNIYTNHDVDSYAIYLSGSPDDLKKNEAVLGVKPSNPMNIFRIRKIFKELLRKAKNRGVIVHAHLTWPFLYVALATLGLPKIKLIYTEHSTTNKRRNIPMLWFLERFFYRRYARVICISEGVRNALAKWVGPKIAERLETIPNGSRIYSLIKRSSLDERLPRLVSVGSLSSRKNFATTIRAIGQMRNEIDSYTIVGDGPGRTTLEQIIQQEQLEEKVRLVGWSDSIEKYLHVADIQLIPSLWEGFGLVAVEGMSTGLPVVASNVNGLSQVLGESNPAVTLINNVESVDYWVGGIRKTVDKLNSLGANSLAQSSRHQAEKFTLDAMAYRYLELYRTL